LHLAQCQACRDEVAALTAVDRFYPELEHATDDAAQQLICDYVDDRLAPQARAEAVALIHNDDSALKAALHYASHAASMSAALGERDTEQGQQHTPAAAKTTGTTGVFSMLGRWLDLRAPLWAVVPATAFAVALLAVSLQTYMSGSHGSYQVASYQDNPVIQFRKNEDLPGIGFFSKADRSTTAYNNVQVEVLDANRIRIDWPQVANALQYSLRLQMFNQNQKLPLGEISTRLPTATFTTAELSSGRRYEWILSGKTTDDKTFYASGGFVINKTD
ncbi:MAG: hypothetical protein WBN96_06560, partial [Gammaproteobacteria bacterium]